MKKGVVYKTHSEDIYMKECVTEKNMREWMGP